MPLTSRADSLPIGVERERRCARSLRVCLVNDAIEGPGVNKRFANELLSPDQRQRIVVILRPLRLCIGTDRRVHRLRQARQAGHARRQSTRRPRASHVLWHTGRAHGRAIPLIDRHEPAAMYISASQQPTLQRSAGVDRAVHLRQRVAELATAVNASLMKHHHCNNTLAMAPLPDARALPLPDGLRRMPYERASAPGHRGDSHRPDLKDRGITLSDTRPSLTRAGCVDVRQHAMAAPPQQPMMTTIPDGVAPGGSSRCTPTGAKDGGAARERPGQQIQVMVPAVRATPQVMVR